MRGEAKIWFEVELGVVLETAASEQTRAGQERQRGIEVVLAAQGTQLPLFPLAAPPPRTYGRIVQPMAGGKGITS